MNEIIAVAFDTETTTRQTNKKFFPADPFFPDNEIVELGCQYLSTKGTMLPVNTYRLIAGDSSSFIENMSKIWRSDDLVIIAHNLKFDLLYLLRTNPKATLELIKSNAFWDTMFVEYLLTGQAEKFPSLDSCSSKYGGTLKDDKVKEYWADGVPTEKIPPDVLNAYLKDDVRNTMNIYMKQREHVKRLGMGNFVMSQMEALIATTIMEWNGMRFNTKKADAIAKDLTKEVGLIEHSLKHLLSSLCGEKPADWNPASPTQLKVALNGGTFNIVRRVPKLDKNGDQMYWKTGTNKGTARFRDEASKITVKTPYWYGDYFDWEDCIVPRGGQIMTGEDVLKNIQQFFLSGAVKIGSNWELFLHDLLKFRGLHKELNTYFNGYSAVVRDWGTIHPSYQHVSTHTGRLSCTSPNLQNVTKKDKK